MTSPDLKILTQSMDVILHKTSNLVVRCEGLSDLIKAINAELDELVRVHKFNHQALAGVPALGDALTAFAADSQSWTQEVERIDVQSLANADLNVWVVRKVLALLEPESELRFAAPHIRQKTERVEHDLRKVRGLLLEMKEDLRYHAQALAFLHQFA